MKSLIFILVLTLSALHQARADDDVELSAFEIQGIRPKQTNGTVSEHVPFMVSIRIVSQEVNEGFGNGHMCGGVVLTRQHVLTVATCVKRSENALDTAFLEIISGTRYRYDDTKATRSSVSRIFVHPDYTIVNGIPNNVAIIYLSQEIPADILTVSAIPISNTPAAVNQNLQIFGWGTPLINNGHRELQTGRITVLDRTNCPQSYIHRFCAGPFFFGGCQGDDGGAAIADGVLYGLVDYRSDTYCVSDSISLTHLFVDVVVHREWIDTIIGTSTTPTTLNGSKETSSLFLILTVIAISRL